MANEWAVLWDEGKEYFAELQNEATELLPDLTVQEIRLAARSFPIN